MAFMAENKYRLILFDISGVLIKLGGMPDFVSWTGMSTEQIKARFLESSSISQFERGMTNYSEFYEQFVEEWEIDISCDDLKAALQSWVSESFDGAGQLLDTLGSDHTLACLTNTNEVQWPVVASVLDVDARFEYQYVSHLMGMVKPDLEVFQYVLNDLGVDAERVLFLDDSEPNVFCAQRLGFDAHQVVGMDAAVELLRSKNVLG